MKLAILSIGLLCLVTLTSAGTFLEAKIRSGSSAEFLTPEKFSSSLKSSDFGKSLLSLLSLQFKTTGKLDDVNSLISDLQAKLRQQQTDDDTQYTATTAANTQIVNDQTVIIATANTNIQVSTQQISDDQLTLGQLITRQTALQQEAKGLQDQITLYTNIRATEAAAFAARVKDENTLITSIQKVLNLFQQATNSGNFNADAVAQIVNLLEQLLAAYRQSIIVDTQQEDQAIQNLQDFVTSANNRITVINSLLQALATEILRLQNEIARLQSYITEQTTVRDNAQNLKDTTIAAQAALDARYNNNKGVRANQLTLLASAVVTLNNNSAQVQNYLNQA